MMKSRSQKNARQIIHPQSHYSKLGKWLKYIPTLFTSCVSVSGWFCCSCDPNSALPHFGDINSFFSRTTSVTLQMRPEGHWVLSPKVGGTWNKPALQAQSPQQARPPLHQAAWIPPLPPHVSSFLCKFFWMHNISIINLLKLKHSPEWTCEGETS